MSRSDEPPDREEDAAPTWPRRVRPLPRDQLAMPPQEGIRRRDRVDLAQCPAIRVGEAQSAVAELPA